MPKSAEPSNLPAQITDAIIAIPRGLVPTAAKALDRLLGAAAEVPVAWLRQKTAKIEAQTEAYRLVEASIAKAAALEAGADEGTIHRAVEVLVRKAYRKQANREAVAIAMIEDLGAPATEGGTVGPPPADVDDDWLNVFERYAEDASSERMQKLWGRVLAGEVRRPGRFSARTLRFLSEFSKADALTLEEFSRSSFGDTAPRRLAKPESKKDIRHLIYLEANGLIQGASGELTRELRFSKAGRVTIREGGLAIIFYGSPNTSFKDSAIALTPLGQELVSLMPGRDARAAGRAVAHAMRKPEIKEAHLAVVSSNDRITHLETLWSAGEPNERRSDA